jgi:alpha-tubulin suppressor-like RCC1 family protein
MLTQRISSRYLIAAIAFTAGCSSYSATINKVEYDAGNASGGFPNSGGNASAGGSGAVDSGVSTGGKPQTTTAFVGASGGAEPGGASGVGGAITGGATSLTGGAAATGGNATSNSGVSTGGTTSTVPVATGGVVAVGGTSSNGVGGTSAVGGSTLGVGGAVGTGGVALSSFTAVGGTSLGTGGVSPIGGNATVVTGGATASAGGMSTGGSVGTGGTSSTQNSIKVLTSGLFHTCVQYMSGRIKCWGSNIDGQLGNGTTADSYVPVDVAILSMNVDTTVASGNGTCAILSDGTLQCWGNNDSGELGDGTTITRSAPAPVLGLPATVSGAGLGSQHGCALLNDATVKCWGSNYMNALGNHNTADSLTPTDVYNVNSARSISVEVNTSCVVLNGGSINCWGSNSSGQLGNGNTVSTNVPVVVSNIPTSASTKATQVSVSGSSVCALLSDKTVMCWGANGGLLGNNDTTNSAVPVQVKGITNATYVAGPCALLADSTVKCWGNNGYGQLGNNNYTGQLVPVSVVGPLGSGTLSGVSAISHSSGSACALVSPNQVYCWGENTRGQLGNGTTSKSPIPVLVSGL